MMVLVAGEEDEVAGRVAAGGWARKACREGGVTPSFNNKIVITKHITVESLVFCFEYCNTIY